MSEPIAKEAVQYVAGGALGHDGFIRADVSETEWIELGLACARGVYDLLALWFDNGCIRMALRDWEAGTTRIASLRCPDRRYPSIGGIHAPAIRLERQMRDLYGCEPAGLQDERAWLAPRGWPRCG